MEKELKVSSKISRLVYEYLKEEFNIKGGIYYTTRKLYTQYDYMAMKNEKIFNMEEEQVSHIEKKRLENFLYINSLKSFNTPIVFEESIKKISKKKNKIIIIPNSIIKALIAKAEIKETLDLYIDNVVVTIDKITNGKNYFMIADYITYSLD